MAARDRWSYEVKCPQCGTVGKADVSENDYPFMRKVDHTVDHLTEGFEVLQAGDTASATLIGCQACKVQVE